MNEQEMEEQLKKMAVAPRVTPEQIEAVIHSEYYFTAADGVDGARESGFHTADEDRTRWEPLGLLTFCVLVLQNGFTVTGKSAPASPENFNAELGKQIARKDAISQMWPLLGYALKNQLYEAELRELETPPDPAIVQHTAWGAPNYPEN